MLKQHRPGTWWCDRNGDVSLCGHKAESAEPFAGWTDLKSRVQNFQTAPKVARAVRALMPALLAQGGERVGLLGMETNPSGVVWTCC